MNLYMVAVVPLLSAALVGCASGADSGSEDPPVVPQAQEDSAWKSVQLVFINKTDKDATISRAVINCDKGTDKAVEAGKDLTLLSRCDSRLTDFEASFQLDNKNYFGVQADNRWYNKPVLSLEQQEVKTPNWRAPEEYLNKPMPFTTGSPYCVTLTEYEDVEAKKFTLTVDKCQ